MIVLRRLRRLFSPPAPAPAPRLSFGSWDRLTGDALVVCHPEWRGVRAAAYTFRAPVVETADAGAAAPDLVAAMTDAGVAVVVVHGFPPGTDTLLRLAAAAGIGTRLVLHSSMTQHGAEPGEAAVAAATLALTAEGILERVGFVKEGLAEAFAALGHPAAYVPNRIPDLPPLRRVDLGPGLHVGIFAEPFWRKNVAAQLGAVALMPGATAHLVRRPEVGYLDAVPAVEHGTLPWDRFVHLQGSVDLNLYATLSECQPMTPVESYGYGVPCLVSRTSAVFRDDPVLWDLSTIDEADNPRAIAAAAHRLLERRKEAVAAARAWMAAWDDMAARRWEEFVAA